MGNNCQRKEIEAAIAEIKTRLAAKLQCENSIKVVNIRLSDDEKFVIYSFNDGTENQLPVANFMRAVRSSN